MMDRTVTIDNYKFRVLSTAENSTNVIQLTILPKDDSDI